MWKFICLSCFTVLMCCDSHYREIMNAISCKKLCIVSLFFRYGTYVIQKSHIEKGCYKCESCNNTLTITAFSFIFSLLDIFFTYISNVIPFPGFLSPCSPTHPLLLPGPGIPLYWGIQSLKDQGPLLPLMANQAILCCIYSQRHKI